MKAVLFDLDETLVVDALAVEASFRYAAELLPKGADLDAFARNAWKKSRQLVTDGPYGQLCVDHVIASSSILWSSFDECHEDLDCLKDYRLFLREAVWRLSLADIGLVDDVLASKMCDAYIDHRRLGPPLIDGADKVLSQLRPNFKLGLVTNGPPDCQLTKIRTTGIDSYFDTVVISGECGFVKPDPRSYRLALERLEVNPQEAVFVGDHWKRDVLGPLGIGMQPIWLSRGRLLPEKNPNVKVVEVIDQVLDFLVCDS